MGHRGYGRVPERSILSLPERLERQADGAYRAPTLELVAVSRRAAFHAELRRAAWAVVAMEMVKRAEGGDLGDLLIHQVNEDVHVVT